MRNGISDVNLHQKSLFGKNQKDQNMSKLPKRIRNRLNKEACDWDASIATENAEHVENLLDRAEPFEVSRPPRQPVSLHLDPFDLALLKRLARRKGLPHTQLMAMWLHERIEQEKGER